MTYENTGSILPTFYEQLFFYESYLCSFMSASRLGYYFFGAQENCHKILVKLTYGLGFSLNEIRENMNVFDFECKLRHKLKIILFFENHIFVNS
jgi:hypothetical protein